MLAVQSSTHPHAIPMTQFSSRPYTPLYPSSAAASSQQPLSSQPQPRPPSPSPRLAPSRVPSASQPPGPGGSTQHRYRGGPEWRLASGPREAGAGCVQSETVYGSRGRAGCLQKRRWTRQSAVEINARVRQRQLGDISVALLPLSPSFPSKKGRNRRGGVSLLYHTSMFSFAFSSEATTPSMTVLIWRTPTSSARSAFSRASVSTMDGLALAMCISSSSSSAMGSRIGGGGGGGV